MSGQYAFGSTSLGPEAEAETCDPHYRDNGRACAWFTFNCEDITSSMLNIPTCHSGAAQSPIDLNSNLAIPGDPGAIEFQDYDISFGLLPAVGSWPLPAVLRIQNFALQLDFEPLTGGSVLNKIEVSRNKQNAKSGNKKNRRQKQRKNREERELDDLEENLVTPLSENPLLDAQEKGRVKRSVEWPTITGGALGSDK